MSKALFVPLRLSLGTFACLYASPLLAQVTSDGTVNTQVNQNGNVAEVTGGETRGSNLFHSFQDFSIPTGNEAFFNNADNISNIFSRVTGGNISNIDGAIRANGDASLFLINPAGIIFGENARLDIGGSFYGSSASNILFEDGEFSAVDNLQEPILTVKAPIGLGFRDNPGDIINRSRVEDSSQEIIGLEINSGNTLAFIGGNINFESGNVTAGGGKIRLGGLSQAGTVSLNPDGSFSFPTNVALSDITLTNNADVDVRGSGGGNITVDAQNLLLLERSKLLAGIAEGQGSEDAVAGDINIDATESVKIIGEEYISTVENSTLAINNGVGIRNNVGLSSTIRNPVNERSSAVGDGGDINITTPTLELSNVASINTAVYGTGDGGSINITAENITLTGELSVFVTEVSGLNIGVDREQAIGNGGNLNIDTGSIFFNDRASIFAGVQEGAEGDAGNIIINATDTVAFTGGESSHFVVTQLGANSVGNAGDITITADNLNLTNAQLLPNLQSNAEGQGGKIEFNIAGDISIDSGSLITTQVLDNAIGDSGEIVINSNNLSINNESRILADTEGEGNAGNITFNIADTMTVSNGSQILNQIQSNGIGNAGKIDINTSVLNFNNSQLLSNNQAGMGDSGNISIDARNSITLDNNALFLTELSPNSQGKAGNLTLSAPIITISNLSILASDTRTGSIGEAGDIFLNTNTLRVINGSNINSFTETQDDAGNVTVNANTAEFAAGGKIIMATDSDGNAGSINLNISDSLTINGENPLLRPEPVDVPVVDNLNSETGFFVNTSMKSIGNGGRIQVNEVNSLNLLNNAKISAASEGTGNGGSIFINIAPIMQEEDCLKSNKIAVKPKMLARYIA